LATHRAQHLDFDGVAFTVDDAAMVALGDVADTSARCSILSIMMMLSEPA
jgi:hypothetical protein